MIDIDLQYGRLSDYASLLKLPAVQKELSLKTNQKKEIKAILDKDSRSSDSKNKPTTDEQKESMQTLESELQEVLSKEQWSRCVQLRIQHLGIASFLRKDISEKLELSDDQKTKLAKLNDDQINSAFQRGFLEGFRAGKPTAAERKKNEEKSKADRQKSYQQALKILNEKQREEFDNLRGKLFEFKD